MQTLPNPYSISRAEQPNFGNTDGSDYASWYDLTAREQDSLAKDHPELPYQVNMLPQMIGTMVNDLNNMAEILKRGVETVDTMKGKSVDSQLNKIAEIRDELFELNNSLISLKL